jgi:hypothetical protein
MLLVEGCKVDQLSVTGAGRAASRQGEERKPEAPRRAGPPLPPWPGHDPEDRYRPGVRRVMGA